MTKKTKSIKGKKETSMHFRYNVKMQEKFLKFFSRPLSNLTVACKAVGITRQTYYRLKDTNDDFREQIEGAHQAKGDLVESYLMKKIVSGDTACTIFYCKTQLKDRGYVEKNQLEHSGSEESPVKITGNLDISIIAKAAKEAAKEALDEY